jgi:type IV pilus assembly protein PilY1
MTNGRLSKPLMIVAAVASMFTVPLYSIETNIAKKPIASTGANNPPNLMYLLDDSGSMQQDATPDYVQDEQHCRKTRDSAGSSNNFEPCRWGDPPYMNYDFNTQYYNPAIRYVPAVNYDGTSRPSYTDPTNVPTDPFGVRSWNWFYTYGQVASVNLLTQVPDRVWCINASDANSNLTNCRANGPGNGYVYPDSTHAFSRDAGLTATCRDSFPTGSPPAPDYDCSPSRANTVQYPKYRYGAPYYYNIIPTEHCTKDDLNNCVYSATPTATHPIPARVRWCSDLAFTTCQAKKDGTFRYSKLNFQGLTRVVVTIGNENSSTQFVSFTINGLNIISGSTSASTNANTVADRLRQAINNFVSLPDYTATVSGNQVTISGPRNAAGSFTVAFTKTGSKTVTIGAPTDAAPATRFQRVDIVPAVTSYPKAPARTDCAGATCTYLEEITNYANWFAYYRTRMNMTKTASGRAFASLNDNYRIGLITINPMVSGSVSGNRYQPIDTFSLGAGGQKDNWYTKLYGTGFNGSTPLREALSRVGRHFAGVTGGINSGMGDSPIQASCQQNFTILATDGYWNGNAGQKLDDSAIGDHDNVLGTGANQVPRPLFDGATGASGTLADVAQYYYATDLRPDLANDVPTTNKDTASHQHMTTFTLGLGLAGRLKYEPNYETSTTGDFQKLKQGIINWPVPSANSETALDDLWHAAVNGRGTFFSAQNPQDTVEGLYAALTALQVRLAAGAAAATSNLQPVAGDNLAFTAEYTTQEWTGDLKARTIDLNTGAISPTALWSAQALLEARTPDSRTIFVGTTDTANFSRKLKPFTWTGMGSTYLTDTNLTATEQAYFSPSQLSQFATWNPGQIANASPKNLVEYLRGDKTNHNTDSTPAKPTDLYRNRIKILGDIINAQPAYIKGSPLSYSDYGHANFVKCTQGTAGGPVACPSGLSGSTERQGTVFVAANDGMLHAFDTEGATPGDERWAFIPTSVLPNLYKLATDDPSKPHEYYVDGSPVVGDICVASDCKADTVTATSWRTILVGGLNLGGRGYYALEVTNPSATNVRLLWEFKVRTSGACAASLAAAEGASDDCDLGYSFGNPIIGKRKSDGKWVVLVTSGYNNFNPGDGKGYLYMLDAAKGTILKKIPLDATAGGAGGSSSPGTCVPAAVTPVTPYCNADPVGLAKINVRLESNESDNTILEVFGGDLKGRVWRFDLSSATNAYPAAFRLAQLNDPMGNPQPITTRPEIAKIKDGAPPIFGVFVGTGRYLGNPDLSDAQTQTIYAIKSSLNTTLSDARTSLVSQTLSGDIAVAGGVIRTVTSSNTVDWNSGNGWYVDFPVSKERVNVDPSLQIGTLVVPTNVPAATGDCTAGGSGYLNYFDYQTGRYVETSTAQAASYKVAGSLIVGTNTVKLPGNKLVTITTTADNQQLSFEAPVKSLGLGGRRVSWREIVD